MNIQKKYSRAAISSNLKCDDKHHDVDTLMAVALCGVPLGPILLRAKFSNDVASVRQLRHLWLDVVKNIATTKNWPKNIKPNKVAATSIGYWLNSVCPVCHGRKSDLIDNTPCLTGVDCEACDGSGKSPIPCDELHARYVEKMAYDLDGILISAQICANGKLKSD